MTKDLLKDVIGVLSLLLIIIAVHAIPTVLDFIQEYIGYPTTIIICICILYLTIKRK